MIFSAVKDLYQDARVKSSTIQLNYQFIQSSSAASEDEVWRVLSILTPSDSMPSETWIQHNKMMDALHSLHIER